MYAEYQVYIRVCETDYLNLLTCFTAGEFDHQLNF